PAHGAVRDWPGISAPARRRTTPGAAPPGSCLDWSGAAGLVVRWRDATPLWLCASQRHRGDTRAALARPWRALCGGAPSILTPGPERRVATRWRHPGDDGRSAPPGLRAV